MTMSQMHTPVAGGSTKRDVCTGAEILVQQGDTSTTGAIGSASRPNSALPPIPTATHAFPERGNDYAH